MAIVLEVCTITYTLVIYWPKHRHACSAIKTGTGCVAGAGRSEIIRVKSKIVMCWAVLVKPTLASYI